MKLPGFIQFMRFNNIDEETVKNAARYLGHRYIEKGKFLFHQGDISKHFYGIIKGKISIQTEQYVYDEIDEKYNYVFREPKKIQRSYKTPKVNDNNYKMIETLKFVIDDGHCFGEWGLLDNKNNERSSSAKALEDTHLFSMEKEHFILTLNRCLVKSNISKQKFLKEIIKPLDEEGCRRTLFSKLYKDITPVYLTQGDYLYLEGQVADSVYLLYHGSASLKKNLISNPDPDKPEIEGMKLVNLLFLGEGSIVGLESMSKEKRHLASVFCESSEYTIFFKIPIDKLVEVGESVILFLNEQFKIYNDKVAKCMGNYVEYKNKYRVYYHKDYLDKGIRKEKYIEGDERLISRNIKETIDEIKKKQIHKYINDFNSYNLVKKSLSTRCLNKEEVIDSRSTLRNNPYADKLRLKFFELTKVDEAPLTERTSSRGFKKLMTIKRNKKLDNLTVESNPSVEKTNTSMGFKRINLQTEPDTSRLATNYDYTMSHEILPTTSRTKFRTIDVNDTKNPAFGTTTQNTKTESQDSNLNFYKTINEMRSDLKPFTQANKVKIKLVLNERLVHNLKTWKKLQKKPDKFNTGCFNIPLISNIK
jgi:CRP-like cAMP-binding protein